LTWLCQIKNMSLALKYVAFLCHPFSPFVPPSAIRFRCQNSILSRGGFYYRRYRRSPRAPLRGGRKKLRPAKKKKKTNVMFFFLLDRVFFPPPLYLQPTF